MKYAAPTNQNDDSVMSLALAVHGWRKSRGSILGVVDFFKNRAKQIAAGVRDWTGELLNPKPEPVVWRKSTPARAATVEDAKEASFRKWQGQTRDQAGPPCPACRKTCTTYINGKVLHCNDCGADDGIAPIAAVVDGGCPKCGMKMQRVANDWYCMNDGQAPTAESKPRGATFRDLKRGRGLSDKLPVGWHDDKKLPRGW